MMRTHFSRGNVLNSETNPGAGKTLRLKPHKRWGDDGVASTVGTIMAMMVFLSALSMFTSQYIPVYMEENEASHMSEAYGQFAALKQAVDLQILAGTIQGTSPVQMFSPIKLGAPGIPMFASPTPGYLSTGRLDSYNNVSFSFKTNATISHDVKYETGGSISLYVANRYYIPQELAYENDALILKQSDGQYMKAMPQFKATLVGIGNNGTYLYDISYTLVDMRGLDSNYVGFGTRGVQTTLKSVTTTTFTNLTGEAGLAAYDSLFIKQRTWYPTAWNSSFNQILREMPLSYYNITLNKLPNNDPIDDFYEIVLRIRPEAIARFTLTVAYVEISTAEMGAT
ncbi:MAG: hypothetical protein R6W91_05910 [Thermoplasmata archaeon]